MTEPTKAVPCPFCGSSRIGVHKYKQRRAVGFRARCLNCGISQLGMCHGDHEQAIAAWNTRTPQPTQAQAGAVPLTDVARWISTAQAELDGVETDDANNCLKAAHGAWGKALSAINGIKGGQHGAE